MNNFDTFTSTPQFESFASVAISAERILHIDPSACVPQLPQGDGVCRKMDVLGG